MNEEKYDEKELEQARLLGELMDGAAPGEGAGDPDVELELETAAALAGVLGDGPGLKPEFDATLRARLVREAGKKGGQQSRPAAAPMRRKWMQYAVAAVFVIVLAPTLWIFGDRVAEERKLEKIQEYDKMYVPFSQQLENRDYGGVEQDIFSREYNEKVREMSRDIARKRAASYYDNYRSERRFGP